jgi:hypothetical protein
MIGLLDAWMDGLGPSLFANERGSGVGSLTWGWKGCVKRAVSRCAPPWRDEYYVLRGARQSPVSGAADLGTFSSPGMNKQSGRVRPGQGQSNRLLLLVRVCPGKSDQIQCVERMDRMNRIKSKVCTYLRLCADNRAENLPRAPRNPKAASSRRSPKLSSAT